MSNLNTDGMSTASNGSASESSAPVLDMAPVASLATKPAVTATVTINSDSLVNIFFAALGVGSVLALFVAAQYVGQLFVAAVPFIFGGFLFATIVSAFFMLLNTQKKIRRSASMRFSLAEAYTAVAIFIVMGYLATSCMHAFQGTGLALQFWNQGVSTTALAVIGFGMGKFCASLWNHGANAKKS